MLLCGFVLAGAAIAAEPSPPPEKAEHEALPLHAVPLVQIGKFGITNSMLVTWIVAAGIIILAQTAMRNPKPIPGRRQNFWEWLVEGLYNFLEGIIGRKLVQKTFWFFATLFIFILFVNWFGLIPGVGTIGWGYHDPTTGFFHVDRPLLRGGNAEWHWRLFTPSVWTERRDHRLPESDNGRDLLFGWMARGHLDSVPPRLPKFSTFRKHLCRRKYAGGDV